MAIAGSIGDDVTDLVDVGIIAVFSICSRPMTLDEAMADAAALLGATAEQVARLFAAAASGPP